jgi:arylsulfatase A-like enzyme
MLLKRCLFRYGRFPSALAVYGFVILLGCALIPRLVSAATPPNVVVFLVDDLGQRDLGCYGSSFYETPNLDRLAAAGARFTNAYATCPVCSPTRASMMTGLWPQRVGITDYIGAPSDPTNWNRNTKLVPAPYSERLELEQWTIAKALKKSGYATMFAGKWHLGPEGYWPENQGFDFNFGGVDKGGPYGGDKYFSPFGNPRLTDGPKGEHLPDRLASETCKFIEDNRNKPFFAYFSFYSVHTPLMARDDLKKKYEAKRERLGLKAAWGREETRDVRLVQEHAVYASMVDAMDLAVGKVIAKLDELKLSDNTLVIFTSDNGGLSTSEGWPTSNVPLRGGKGWMYEGGIRVPFLVKWPSTFQGGTTISTPVASVDVASTILDATKTSESQTSPATDGTSLLPLLKGGKLEERALCWHYPHYGNQGGAPAAAIRKGDWKLIEWFEEGKIELFNIASDISEANDLSKSDAARVAKMHQELKAWQKEVGAKFPEKNLKFDPSKQNGRIANRPN